MDSCRIRILPNLESFPLCHYTANLLRELPIDGFYQMKVPSSHTLLRGQISFLVFLLAMSIHSFLHFQGEKVVELLVQLKLDERVRNNFEFCELQIPFFHRYAFSVIF